MSSIVVGLSGGVDSKIAATLLMEDGFDVIGVTILIPGAKEVDTSQLSKELGFEIIKIDVSERFHRLVLDPFKKSYEIGKTPNPCVLCNPLVKFASLTEFADSKGIDFIATGHYAGSKNGFLLRGKNPDRDQSYMLHRLSNETLTRTIFPLYNVQKQDVIQLAENMGFTVSKDSQDLCFSPANHYTKILCAKASEGNIVDLENNVIGTHNGVHNYTVGQKLGMFGKKLYVKRIDHQKNLIVLCSDEKLFERSITIKDVNWILEPDTDICEVRIRHTRKLALAKISKKPSGKVNIDFFEPRRAPAPGQSAVMYSGEYVLGGGFII